MCGACSCTAQTASSPGPSVMHVCKPRIRSAEYTEQALTDTLPRIAGWPRGECTLPEEAAP